MFIIHSLKFVSWRKFVFCDAFRLRFGLMASNSRSSVPIEDSAGASASPCDASVQAVWSLAVGVRALTSADRHLGHTVWDGRDWVAYDAIHANAAGDGFLCLGRFEDAGAAMRAIENSVGAQESLTVSAATASEAEAKRAKRRSCRPRSDRGRSMRSLAASA